MSNQSITRNTYQDPVSVSSRKVVMQDDSMYPIFFKGDELTVNEDICEEPGDYMLVRVGHLLAIRRYTDRGDNNHYDFLPENPVYPAILDDGSPDPWGVVSAVQHVDGTTQTFDLSTHSKISEFEMSEQLEAIVPSAALSSPALHPCS